MKTNIRIALTNLGQYNEGSLNYVWLELPASEDEINDAKKAIGINKDYEEFFISDHEAPFNIGEYENIEDLNEKAQDLEIFDEGQKEVYAAYINDIDDDHENAFYIARDREYSIYHDCYNMSDVAREKVEQGMFNINEDDFLSNYIDYDKLGRDLSIEGTYIEMSGYYIEFHN